MVELLNPSFVVEDTIVGDKVLKALERYGRTCYKSEEAIGEGTAEALLRKILKSGHESVIEHEKVTIRVICDRGVTHEIVRHWIGSYSQESTRYCNYRSKGVRFILPLFFLGEDNQRKYQVWLRAMESAEAAYLELIELGAKPEEARTVLPNSLKTEIVITYNIRQWRHFFRLRTSKRAHPQMREITIPLLAEFQRLIPLLFDDIVPEA